jgi:hypothetical protein
MQSSTIRDYRLRRASLILSFGCECRICGTSRNLQFHHKDGNGDSHAIGGWRQLLRLEQEIKEGVALELLCKHCHQLEHNRLHLGQLEGAMLYE